MRSIAGWLRAPSSPSRSEEEGMTRNTMVPHVDRETPPRSLPLLGSNQERYLAAVVTAK